MERITKSSLILASPDRVWAAITDANQLATWFGAEFSLPFGPGLHVVGRIVPTKVFPPAARARKAYTGLPIELDIGKVEPSRLLTFLWSPFAFFRPDLRVGATTEVVVEIALDPRGARLQVTESLDGVQGDLLDEAVETIALGWTTQIRQLELFLSGAIDLRPVKD